MGYAANALAKQIRFTAIGYHRITNSGMFGYHRKSFKRF
jgi:hypothetical protein